MSISVTGKEWGSGLARTPICRRTVSLHRQVSLAVSVIGMPVQGDVRSIAAHPGVEFTGTHVAVGDAGDVADHLRAWVFPG